MHSRTAHHRRRAARTSDPGKIGAPAASCERVVDISLAAIVLVVPLLLGGKHDFGRLVFVALAGVAGAAWFLRQALSRDAAWNRTPAITLCGIMVVVTFLQIVPLPASWLEVLAPRNLGILPTWSADATGIKALQNWQTLSLTPGRTGIGLATLIAYVLLFVTVLQRLQSQRDVERLLKLIAVSAILMAAFGLLQYFTSNGKFFWFFEVPFTNTKFPVKGGFTCQNHFADFLTLGLGPLFAWILLARRNRSSRHRRVQGHKLPLTAIMLHVGLAVLVSATLMTFSRGGALALASAVCFALLMLVRRGLISSTYLYGLACLLGLVVGLLSTDAYDKLAERLGGFISGSLEELDYQAGRRRVWAANVSAIGAGGLFGSGVGSHREIYPLYIKESAHTDAFEKEYTHAENSYLQIATENGYVGAALLAAALGLIGSWCWRALRYSSSPEQLILAVAVSASLLASAVHAVVDFVWFIPACMALVILLVACALRLAQLAAPEDRQYVILSQPTWLGLALSACLAAVWAVHTTWSPGLAGFDWDKYYLASIEERNNNFKQLKSGDPSLDFQDLRSHSSADAMIYHLQNILAKDPCSARAHIRLAGLCLQAFEEKQQQSQNAMSVAQIRAAATRSHFPSSTELRQWLQVAFGPESKLLYQSFFHACRGLQLCPLQAEGYLYLANLSFLQGSGESAVDSLVRQAAILRPHDGSVLFEVGRHYLVQGEAAKAIKAWREAYHVDGPSRLSIIRLLAGRIPAQSFLTSFEPDWHSLQQVWEAYRAANSLPDLQVLLQYAQSEVQDLDPDDPTIRPERIWLALSKMQLDVDDSRAALSSLERGFQITPDDYDIRRALGHTHLLVGDFAAAQAHLKWCLTRRPRDGYVKQDYVRACQEHDLQEAGLTKFEKRR